MAVRDEIKSFVQHTLGCGCPEEVFGHIDWEENVKSPGTISYSRINIGNRLLVYIAALGHREKPSKVLPALMANGRQERDRLGFNRFRLVISTDVPEDTGREAAEIFEMSGKDEKMHLHVIPTRSIPLFREHLSDS